MPIVGGRVGRDDRIRTCDPLTPSQVRYQAALHPDTNFHKHSLTTQCPTMNIRRALVREIFPAMRNRPGRFGPARPEFVKDYGALATCPEARSSARRLLSIGVRQRVGRSVCQMSLPTISFWRRSFSPQPACLPALCTCSRRLNGVVRAPRMPWKPRRTEGHRA